jgi:hypothetical protein
VTAATVVAEDWALDPLEPAGASELFRRVEAAPVERVSRAALAGHVGLTDRELYRLGCTTASPGAGGIVGAVGWRVIAFAGAVVAAIGLAFAVAGMVVPLLGGPPPVALGPRGRSRRRVRSRPR